MSNAWPNGVFYHATTRQDWLQQAQAVDLKVHVGTARAAVERVREYTKADAQDQAFYLWAVTVAPNIPYWPTIEEDWGIIKRFREIPDAVRYFNLVEDKGEVSLYVLASALTAVALWTGTMWQAGDVYVATFDDGQPLLASPIIENAPRSTIGTFIRRWHYTLTQPNLVRSLDPQVREALFRTARITVASTKRGLLDVTPAVLDDQAELAYSFGQCAALAVALHEATGWEIGYAAQTNGWIHVYIALPDELCMDVYGLSLPDSVWSKVTHFSTPDELRTHLDGLTPFGYPSEAELALARTFVKPVLRRAQTQWRQHVRLIKTQGVRGLPATITTLNNAHERNQTMKTVENTQDQSPVSAA